MQQYYLYHYIHVFILFISLLLIPVSSQEQGGETFKVGLVADEYGAYKVQDTEVKEGVLFWAKWINDLGGLYYNGSFHDVQVLTTDASTSNANKTTALVQAAYEDFARTSKVNLMLCPTTTGRTTPSLKVSEKYKIINFGVSAITESLFTSNDSFIFATVPSTDLVGTAPLIPLVKQGAKTYVIQQRNDAYSVLVAPKAIDYLNRMGLTMLKSWWVNTSSVDVDQLTKDLRVAIREQMENVTADIFITSGLITDWPTFASVFDSFTPNVKAAAYLGPLQTTAQTVAGIGNVGDYWLAPTRFDPKGNYGISGQLGGTTAEFVAAFEAQFGHSPVVNSATAASLLMAYTHAVNGSESADSYSVRQTMKTMGRIETFAGSIEFQANGTNKWPVLVTMQCINGNGVVQTGDVIYPHQFLQSPVEVKVKEKNRTSLIVGVVVPVAVIVIAVAIGAIVHVRRQRSHVVKALVDVEEGEKRNYKINYSELVIDTAIGAGGFGVVYKGEYRGAEVAVKKLKTQLSKEQLSEFAREASVMVGLRHPNILLFMGVCLEPHSLCIVTEFMSRGSLYDILQDKHTNLPFPLIKRMLSDTAKGLQYIHSSGMIHRDLKSPNLLVDRSWNIKIADFGLSVAKAHSNNDAQLSLLWSAPEILAQTDGYSEKSDMYSFAIIAWEIMSKKVPFSGMMAAAIAPAVIKGQRPPVQENWPEGIKNLIERCWAQSPAKRLSVKEARGMIEGLHADPDFNLSDIHSSTLEKYIERAAAPNGAVFFVGTTVCHSTKLWERDPYTMVKSLTILTDLVRSTMHQKQGYEVSANGDSYLMSFANVTDAFSFCLRVQTALMGVAWPAALLNNNTSVIQEFSDDDVTLYRGLTVSMGIHQANAFTNKDSDGRIQYVGLDNTPALLAAQAVPGTIVMNSNMYASAMSIANRVDPFSIVSLGERPLLNNNVHLYQAVPKELEERNSQANINAAELNCNQTPTGAEKWSIRWSELEIGDRIGAGSFGEVKLGRWHGQKVAVKEMLKQKVEDNALLEIRAESFILSSLEHENIIRFLGMCMEAPHIALVTEFMEKGDLGKLLAHSGHSLSWPARRKMAKDMATGLAYLHDRHILHRDIKSSNMLVAADNTVKIADFGFSRMKMDNQTMTQQGTVAWTAPEIFEGENYTEKCDIYSFGIVLWELCACKKPWTGSHNMRVVGQVLAGNRPSLSEIVDGPSDIIKLMQECWAPNPASRPPFKTIVDRLAMSI